VSFRAKGDQVLGLHGEGLRVEFFTKKFDESSAFVKIILKTDLILGNEGCGIENKRGSESSRKCVIGRRPRQKEHFFFDFAGRCGLN
jgi:hypothetical protein